MPKVDILDATGFGFGDKYNLNWKRGTQIRTVQSHVRLEVIMAVDENKRKIITAVETGGPYESEIEMLRKALKKLQPQKGLPFVADKGYDAVDIIESLLDRGFEPAIRIKETMRMSIKHPLRKLSNENWKRYGKIRCRVEQLFGSIKQKIGSSFKLLREDLARKASIACAILWNFWLLATYLFLLFLSGILHYGYAKDCGRFLEQPQHSSLSDFEWSDIFIYIRKGANGFDGVRRLREAGRVATLTATQNTSRARTRPRCLIEAAAH
jgi:hypothetical protein